MTRATALAEASTDASTFTLTGATVVTMNATRHVLTPGFVKVQDGRIAEVGPGRPREREERTRDLSGRVVLPGFVNTHAHLVSALTRGLGGDRFLGGGISGGRERAGAIRERMDAGTSYAGARLALAELALSGVTTTTDSYAARRGLEDGIDGALQAWTESGLRGTLYRASVDRTEIIPSHRHDSPDLAVRELERLHDRWASDRLGIGAEAMALHRVGHDLLDAIAAWARERGAPFAMHLAYNEAAAEHAVTEYGSRLIHLLADWGILDARFLGYHPILLDDGEIEAVASAGAGLAVCGPANMLIGLGPAPLPELIDAGTRVSLGTDQPNDGHNFFEVMKGTMLQQRASQRSTEFGSAELMLELATIGGAHALHLEDEIGSIEPGKRADLVVVDARRPALSPATSRISDLVLAASPADIEAVFVDGEAVVDAGRLVPWDEREVADEADRVVAAALRAAGLRPEPFTSWPVVSERSDSASP